MGLDINLNTSKIDISEDDGLNVDLYGDNVSISEDDSDDIIIEITGLKSINKFIGLEDTPLYYDNGKFFKVENNKIIYTDIEWGDISGDLNDAPEIVALIQKLIEKTTDTIVNNYIHLHNINQEAHPYIQNIIQDNYNILNRKIDNSQEELFQDITSLTGALDNEIEERQAADSLLSENLQEETLARIDAQTSLYNDISNLNTLLEDEVTARTEGDSSLENSLGALTDELLQEISDRQTQDNTLQGQITSNFNVLNEKINTESNDRVESDTLLQNNIDTLTNNVNSLSTTVSNNYTTLDNKINSTKTELEGDIDTLSTTVTNNYNDLSGSITSNVATLNNRIDSEVSTLNTAISTETTNRQNADNNLQSQIDAITSASDVTDIVGTYAQLQAYDTTGLPVNDIIKVLNDETHDNASSYYRWNGTAWLYIGSEGPFYTKSETDNEFVPQTRTVNGKPLSTNVVLTATDVNALPNTTVIGDGVLSVQKNGTTIDTFSANTTENKSINITVPTDTSDLTNNAGFITSEDLPQVNNGTLDIQVNGTSIGTFTANQSGNTTANIVVPDSATWGNITGNIEDQTDLQDALNDKQDVLTAGTGIDITNNIISNTQTSAEWGNITGDIEDQTDLQNILDTKQDTLVAGTDLEIVVGSGTSNTVSGTNSIILSNASANSLSSVIVYGECSQIGTPTTSNPIDIVCNNGAIKYNTGTSSFYTEGTVETVIDSLNNTATAEMLLGFGDYIDTQDLLGVGGTRKVGLMVLTGTEEFDTTTLTNCYTLESALGNINLTDRTVYCTHFQHASTLPAVGSRQGYALIGNRSTPSNAYTVGFGATTEFSTVALFKSWLATQYANGTPVIIAYPLATPTTFGASAQTLDTKAGSNQLTITQSAISNLSIKATYTTDSTSTINFTNESGYILSTQLQSALENYYTKSQTYTKTEVNQLIADIPKFTVSVVQSLPATGEAMTLYLVPKTGTNPDIYNEYVWVESTSSYELIGSTAVDLSDYYNKTETDTLLNGKQDKLTAGRYIEIVKGGTLSPLPSGCSQVEYITATGTQHLDTLITASQDYEIRAKFRLSELNDSFLYGARQAYGYSSFALHKNYAPFSTDVGTGYVNLGVDSWYYTKQNKNGIYINDVIAHSYNNSLASFTTPNTIRVFAMAQGNNALYGNTFMKGDFAEFEIYNNGNLVCKLVPCIDTNDVACMYDTVNERFLYNQGTGTFTAGAVVAGSDTINCTIEDTDISTILGYTPVKSVNNILPVDGNITLTLPASAEWGNITGTLSNQTDLQNALNAKSKVTIKDWTVN